VAKITSYGAPPYHVPVVDIFVVGNRSCSIENSRGEKLEYSYILKSFTMLTQGKVKDHANLITLQILGKVITSRTARDNSSGSR
jgi:hypothetical protein